MKSAVVVLAQMCLMILAGVVLPGCLTRPSMSGYPDLMAQSGITQGSLDKSKLQQLEKGVSTKEHVAGLLGPPRRTITASDGTVTLMYQFMGETLGFANMKTLMVVLDASGKLDRWILHEGGDTLVDPVTAQQDAAGKPSAKNAEAPTP